MQWIKRIAPRRILIYGYLALSLIGFGLLCLPIFQKVSAPVLDHLFIATSALSTTGLSTISISEHYNLGGIIVILLLIQLGGMGYMSIASFITLLTKKRLNSDDEELVKFDFSLPDNFNLRSFIRNLVIFSLLIEAVGAILLGFIFWNEGVEFPFWYGLFHSISAFCTAGFSLFSDSFEGFSDNFYLNVVISVLAIVGSTGFIVLTDFFKNFTRRRRELTLTSRIILRFTGIGIAIGMLVIFFNSNIGDLPIYKRLMIAFFQSVTSFTTVGFNTYPISSFAQATIFILLLIMLVGASPSGTGGGVKSTTIASLLAQLRSTLRTDKKVVIFNKRIPFHRLQMAVSNFVFYNIVLCIGIFFLLTFQEQNPFDLLFEAVSALGTVGLSTGITGDLSILGKWIIIFLMFLGRVGALSFGIAFFGFTHEEYVDEEEDVAI